VFASAGGRLGESDLRWSLGPYTELSISFATGDGAAEPATLVCGIPCSTGGAPPSVRITCTTRPSVQMEELSQSNYLDALILIR
jgi:hypothetical protein